MNGERKFSLNLATAFAVPGVLVGHRRISLGDEHSLLHEEEEAFRASVLAVRRASGAARIVARQLLGTLGLPKMALPRSKRGPPIWPAGIVASLAHDSRYAVAAAGLRKDFRSIGIDIEPAVDLPHGLLDLVATPRERAKMQNVANGGKLLFVAKEATYKALFPIEKRFLEHHDVEIDFATRKARVRDRVIDLRFRVSTHIVALAIIRA